MHIMSVDDSRAVHAYLIEIFESSSVMLDHYFNGQEVIDALSKPDIKPPDVILLDWEMPVKSGIEALPVLRSKLPDAIIIMATSKSSIADIALALDKGASDYIMKPFTKEILISKIEQLLGRAVV